LNSFDQSQPTSANTAENQSDSKNSTVKQSKKELKKKIIKEKIVSIINVLDQVVLSEEVITAAKDKLKTLDEKYSKNNFQNYFALTYFFIQIGKLPN